MSKDPYRYRLTRGVGPRTVLWVGVNPSTAKDQKPGEPPVNDPTVTKIEGFTARYFPAHMIFLANKFARIATDVRGLRGMTLADAIGPECDQHLLGMMAVSHSVVFAWGPLAKLPVGMRERWREVDWWARAMNHTPLCLGVCQDGQPRHPLMVPYATVPQPWSRPA